MPQLGVPTGAAAVQAGGVGISQPGVWVPAGSLDKWRAARDASASSLCEVAIFGDSTTFGSANGTPAFYSWIQKLRALSRAAGFADGGRGIVGINDYTTLTTGGPSNEDGTISYQSLGGWAGAGGPLLSETFGSTTGGQALVLQGYGTKCRLHFSKTQTSGQITVSVDGGAATTYETYTPRLVGGSNGYFSAQSVLLTLGSYGLHTVTVTNVGGSVVNPPDLYQVSNGGGAGTLNGTYYYAATCLTGSGETPIGATVNRTTSGAQSIQFFITPNDLVSAQQWRIYRSTTGAAGSYRLLDTIASSLTSYTDDGSKTPSATAPPSTNTAGLDTGRTQVQVVGEFINDTGIVYHRNAVSGTTYQSFFGKGNWYFNLLSYTAVAFGLTPDTALNNYAVDNAEAAHPPYRKVRLAISALGVNNQQGTTDTTTLATNLNYVREGLHVFALMARNAGADPLVVIPHYDMAVGGDYGGAFREATVATARALHLPIVDFNIALGPKSLFTSKGYVNNVHSNQAVYDAEATFLWNNVLSL